jgi:small subunit ribosomal protein S9
MPEAKRTVAKPKTVKKPVKAEPAAKVVKPAAKPAVKAAKAVVDKTPKKTVAAVCIAQMGKRKNATASVRLTAKGSGVITVNGQPMEKYFDSGYQRKSVESPLKQVGLKDFTITILAKGGGNNGQADAARLGITKALVKLNAELRPSLKARGWLTRDPRIKERKKPGLKR